MAKLLALDKLGNLFRIVKQNGGVTGCVRKIFRIDELKDGQLVGEDKYGNKYYENPRYFYARDRWVEYSPRFGFDYDGSQVPAEWYGWLHHKTDLPPHEDPYRPRHKWLADHTENLTGTKGQFVPYSTTRSKIEPWVPKQR